jgi:hypothetical protein
MGRSARKSFASPCCSRLAGKTPALAVEAFLAPLRRSISCLTKTVLNVGGGYHTSDAPHVLVLGDGDPVSLTHSVGLHLSITMQYRLVEAPGARGPWKVQTVAYFYVLADGNDDEIIAYHWHPYVGVTTPHLHVRAANHPNYPDIPKAHFPSGRVSIEEVLRLAIEEFGATSIRPTDWEEILEESQSAFEAWRSWS